MDAKERLIKNLMLKLSGIITEVNLMDKVETILTMEFNDFEVGESKHEVAIRYEDNYRLLNDFLCVKKIEGLSNQSLKRYADINRKVLEFIGKPIKMIKTNDLRYYLATRRQAGNNSVSLDGIRRCISTFYSFLLTEGYIENNPCLQLKQIKCTKTIKKALTDIEMSEVRKGCKSSRDKALIEFMYSTGMRVSEVSHCNIEDINFETKECIVKYAKGGKQRLTYISDNCATKLHEYLKEKECSSPTLFGLSKNGIEQVVNKLSRRTNVEIYPHKIRRTCATVLANSGMDIRYIASILGHSSIQTTMLYAVSGQSEIKRSFMELMN